MHMMEGMVGSLLVINGGEAVTPLPVGRGCPLRVAEPAPPYQPQVKIWRIKITPDSFDPPELEIEERDYVEWINPIRMRCIRFVRKTATSNRVPSILDRYGAVSFSRRAHMTTTASSIITNGGIRPVTILLRSSALSRNRAAAEAVRAPAARGDDDTRRCNHEHRFFAIIDHN